MFEAANKNLVGQGHLPLPNKICLAWVTVVARPSGLASTYEGRAQHRGRGRDPQGSPNEYLTRAGQRTSGRMSASEPPSAKIVWPCTNTASGPSRKCTTPATSSGVPLA